MIRSINSGRLVTGLAAALAGGGCGTAHVAQVTKPQVVHVSHASENLKYALESGMFEPKLLSTKGLSNVDEFGQLRRDTVVATNACNAATEACTQSVKADCPDFNIQPYWECPTWIKYCSGINSACITPVGKNLNEVTAQLAKEGAETVSK